MGKVHPSSLPRELYFILPEMAQDKAGIIAGSVDRRFALVPAPLSHLAPAGPS